MGLFSRKPAAEPLPDDSSTTLEERLASNHWLVAFDKRDLSPRECTYLTNANGCTLMSRWSGTGVFRTGPAIFGIGSGRIFVFWNDGKEVGSVTPPLSAVAGVPRARNGDFQVTFFNADAPREFWFIPGNYETHKAAITQVLDQTGIQI